MNDLLNHYNRAIKRNGKVCTVNNTSDSIMCLFKEISDSTKGTDTKLIITAVQLNQGDLIDSNGIKYMIVTKNEPINSVYTSYVIRECPYTIKLNINSVDKTFYMFTDKQVFDLGSPTSGGVGIIPTDKIYVSVQNTADTNSIKVNDNKIFAKFGNEWQITGIDRTVNGIITYTCKFSSESSTPVTPDHVYKLTVTFGSINIDIGKTSQITATVTDNGTNVSSPVITYTSSDASIATVSNTGLVTAVKAGSCTITVSFIGADNKTYTATVNVSIAMAHSYVLSVTPTTISINKGDTQQITASVTDKGAAVTSPAFAYISSDISIATVNSSGLVNGIAGGTCNITVSFTGEDNKTYTQVISSTIMGGYNITATPSSITVSKGSGQQLTCTPTYNGSNPNGNYICAYFSSNTSIATVDEWGYVTGVSVGTCNIIVKMQDGTNQVWDDDGNIIYDYQIEVPVTVS